MNSFAVLPDSYKSPQVNGSWQNQSANCKTGKKSNTGMKMETGEDKQYLVICS